MKIKFTVAIIAFLTFQTSQAQWWSNGKKVEGNGNATTETRSVGSYDQIAVSGFFDVFLKDGKEGALTVEAESNFMDYIVTEVEGGTLKIRVKNKYYLRPSRRMAVKITVPVEAVEEVSLSGSGDVVGQMTLKAENFKTTVSGSGDVNLSVEANAIDTALSGSGDIKLSGRAKTFTASVSGSGDISCYNLKAEDVEAKVNGSGDLEVYASKSLYARVSGSGDIDYKGNPKRVDKKTSGSGDVTAH